MTSCNYNPNQTRVWSRTQAPCTFYNEYDNYNTVYVQLTKKTISRDKALYDTQMLVKGNTLQYKKNSSNITKSQRYSQICKGKWTNRTTSFATQTQTYSNPNTTSLKRVNAIEIAPNDVPGLPNNISGPYYTDVINPFLCPGNNIQDGGNLICNIVVNPCTNEIIKQTKTQLCFPTTCSDVPGQIIDLCWDPRVATWYDKPHTTMSNSGTKWPQNYKGLVSAYQPDIIIENSGTDGSTNADASSGGGGATDTGGDTETPDPETPDPEVINLGDGDGTTVYTGMLKDKSFNNVMALLENYTKMVASGVTISADDFISKFSYYIDKLSTNMLYSSTINKDTSKQYTSNDVNSSIVTDKNIIVDAHISNNVNSSTVTDKSVSIDTIVTNVLEDTPASGYNASIIKTNIQSETLQSVIDSIAADILTKSLEPVLRNLYTHTGSKLDYFIDKFTQDLTTDLDTEFTYEVFRQLSITLSTLSFPRSGGYTNVHHVIIKALEMLWKTVIASKSQKQIIAQLEDTVYNLTHPQPSLFEQTSSLGVVATIRPEIQIYIDKYGFPPGGIFDTSKLCDIINEINALT